MGSLCGSIRNSPQTTTNSYLEPSVPFAPPETTNAINGSSAASEARAIPQLPYVHLLQIDGQIRVLSADVALLPWEAVLGATVVADTLNGDQAVFHPSNPAGMYLLPRHEAQICRIGTRFENAPEWPCTSGPLCEPVSCFTSSRFRRSRMHQQRSRSKYSKLCRMGHGLQLPTRRARPTLPAPTRPARVAA
jgi:hypothetical protein